MLKHFFEIHPVTKSTNCQSSSIHYQYFLTYFSNLTAKKICGRQLPLFQDKTFLTSKGKFSKDFFCLNGKKHENIENFSTLFLPSKY